MRTAAAAGVEVCFANPGTTEILLVRALEDVPGLRGILGLFEGVCTGAADGYARMTGRPALTLLHHGPGFANGIANLHNAARARSPVVNLIGDHASWHRAYDAPLTTDIVSLARPVSGWVREVTAGERLAPDVAEAIAAATGPPGQVASLIIPDDFQLAAGAEPATVPPPAALPPVRPGTVGDIAVRLRGGARAALILGGAALGEAGQVAAARVAAATGARLHTEMFPPCWERGAGLPVVRRLPYFPEQVIEVLADAEMVILAGTREPVAFFGQEDMPSLLAPPGSVVTLSTAEEDAVGSLEALADALGAPLTPQDTAAPSTPVPPRGPLTPATVGAALALCLPARAIVVDEAITARLPFYEASAGAPRHTLLGVTGGAIGQGLPCATGAAVACPDRKVIAFEADGSALYTLQSLWTQAREGLDVVTLLCANRSYQILRVEFARAGITELGPASRSLTDLARPEIDWMSLARGFGVEARRVETAQALTEALSQAVREPGPRLIEMVMARA